MLGVSLHAFSLVCAVGVTASERAEVMDGKGDMQDKKRRAEQALTEAQARVDALSGKATSIRDELRIADELGKARADVKEAREKLDALKAPGSRDPQSEALAVYLPVSVDQLSKALPLLPSLVVEFGPCLTMLLASVFFGAAAHAAPAPASANLPAFVSTPPPADMGTLKPVEPKALTATEAARALASPARKRRRAIPPPSATAEMKPPRKRKPVEA